MYFSPVAVALDYQLLRPMRQFLYNVKLQNTPNVFVPKQLFVCRSGTGNPTFLPISFTWFVTVFKNTSWYKFWRHKIFRARASLDFKSSGFDGLEVRKKQPELFFMIYTCKPKQILMYLATSISSIFRNSK